MHWYNKKNEPQWRRKRNHKHHCNWHLKKVKNSKAQIRNIVGQTTESLLHHDIKRDASHHHMFMIVGTLTSEER